MSKRFIQGITLVEVCMVIAIVAILAAIITPVFLGARASAKSTHCLSNMSQLARAQLLYANDSNGVFAAHQPLSPGEFWYSQLTPYAKDANLSCLDYSPKPFLNGNIGIGYAINGCIKGRIDSTLAGQVVLIAESTNQRMVPNGQFGPIVALDSPDSVQYSPTLANKMQRELEMPYGAERHKQKGHYAFCDGHVSTLSDTQFRLPLDSSLERCEVKDRLFSRSSGAPSFAVFD